ncbi:hypothetical protein I552_8462 [Mycobacterium xenopi 3993]|nr:hypothetical protein I552_8462 [Mycobacterium xenopi 3993]
MAAATRRSAAVPRRLPGARAWPGIHGSSPGAETMTRQFVHP